MFLIAGNQNCKIKYSFFSLERNENRYQTNWCFKINLLHVFVYYWVFSKVFKTEIMPYTAPEMTVFLFVLGNYTILNSYKVNSFFRTFIVYLGKNLN